jgi:hypothetical protein
LVDGPTLAHPPMGRLLVVGPVRRIVGDLREPFQAGGVDLCDPVLEGGAFDLISLAIPENAFLGHELPLLESLGELGEIPPGEDAVPLGTRFVVAFVVLPTLLGCDVENTFCAVAVAANSEASTFDAKICLFLFSKTVGRNM